MGERRKPGRGGAPPSSAGDPGNARAVRLEVRAKPRAKKSRVVSVAVGRVEVALAAPPVDGAANEELIRFLSDVLGVPTRMLTLLRGEASRTKLVAIEGLTAADVERRLLAAEE